MQARLMLLAWPQTARCRVGLAMTVSWSRPNQGRPLSAADETELFLTELALRPGCDGLGLAAHHGGVQFPSMGQQLGQRLEGAGGWSWQQQCHQRGLAMRSAPNRLRTTIVRVSGLM